MKQAKTILEKIENLISAEHTFSAIEKDLALRYTRDLYETILSAPVQQSNPILTEEPETFTPHSKDNQSLKSPVEIKIESSAAQFKRKDDTEKLKDKLVSEIKKTTTDTSQNNSTFPVSGNFDEDTIAEKMPFDLEPELQNDSAGFSSKSVTDFMLWNKDIRSFIGINDRYNFISELFQNNNEAYEEILTEISLCNTKNEALQFLDKSGITTLYKWKDDGFSEQIFYNILSQFFASR